MDERSLRIGRLWYETMRYSLHALTRSRLIVGGVVALSLLVSAAWSFAISEERTIHVFPIEVTPHGFENTEAALDQALSSRATFNDFSTENAAYVVFGATTSAVTVVPVLPTIEQVSPTLESAGEEGALSDTSTSRTLASSLRTIFRTLRDVGVRADALPARAQDAESGAETAPALNVPDDEPEAPSASEVNEPILEEDTDVEPDLEESDAPVEEQVGSPDEGTTHDTGEEREEGDAGDTEREVDDETDATSEADETTTFGDTQERGGADASSGTENETSTEGEGDASGDSAGGGALEPVAEGEDVRLCTILSAPCHSVRFDGFDIGDVLSEHRVTGYTLKLSLASRSEESFTQDKLLVRYFHEGQWKLAGELTLEGERSNAENGGHYTFPLAGVTGWDGLRDLAVELEYVRQGEGDSVLYLDALWVDATYEVGLDEELPELPNVLDELAALEDGARGDVLTLSPTERVMFPHAGESSGLTLRSDRDIYHGPLTSDMLFSLSNDTDVREEVDLAFSVPPGSGVIARIEQYAEAPYEATRVESADIAQFCESGWVPEVVDGISDAGEDTSTIEETTDPSESPVEALDVKPPVEEEGVVGEPLEDVSEVSDEQEESEMDEEADAFAGENESEAGVQETVLPHPTLPTYSCVATGDTLACSSLNQDRTNCIIADQTLARGMEPASRFVWEERTMSMREVTRAPLQNLLARLRGESDALLAVRGTTYELDTVSLDPRQTLFFRVHLSYAVQTGGEVRVEANGENSSATHSVFWRSGWHYRMPVELSLDSETSDTKELVRVSLDDSFAQFWANVGVRGDDVRVLTEDSTRELPVFLETFDLDRGELSLLIEREGLPSGTSTVYLYYGDAYARGEDRAYAPSPYETTRTLATLEEGPAREVTLVSGADWNDVAIGETMHTLRRGEHLDYFLSAQSLELSSLGPVLVREHDYEELARTRGLTLQGEVLTRSRIEVNGEVWRELFSARVGDVPHVFGDYEELRLPALDEYEAYTFSLTRIRYDRVLGDPKFHTLVSSLRDFALGQKPSFTLAYRPQRSRVVDFFRGLFRERPYEVRSVMVVDPRGEPLDIPVSITYTGEREWKLDLDRPNRSFIPGRYALLVTIGEGSYEFTDLVDFYWGVLALNTPQATYLSSDRVEFHMAALTDTGDTICDARLELTVTDPDGVSESVPVAPTGTCGANNVTDEPDYLAEYRAKGVGSYAVHLAHVNDDGSLVHEMEDLFRVEESVPFVLKRKGATRIWPKAPYTMTISLEAAEDFEGELVEALPLGFKVLEAEGAESKVYGKAKRLVWPVSLKKGERTTLRYTYDAPDISPYLYELGPAEVRAGVGLPYVEARTWKLASDALGSFVELNASLSISTPSTWNITDLSSYGVPANAAVEIAVLRTGGGTRYGGVRAPGSSLSRYFRISRTSGTNYNALSLTTKVSATSSVELYADNVDVSFRLLGYWTSGTYVELNQQIDPGNTNGQWGPMPLSSYGVTSGKVVEMVLGNWNTGADYSAGARSASSTVDRRITLTRPNNNGITALTLNAVASGTNAWIETYAANEQGNGQSNDFWLVGYWSTEPEGMRYVDALDTLTVPGSATVWTDLALDLYGLGKYTVSEIIMGNTGTANSSLEHGVRTNGSSLGRSIALAQARTAGQNPVRMHVTTDNSASSTIENYVSATTNANFTQVGYWRPIDYTPEPPTLYDIPFDNEKTGSSTPYFEFSATDPDGTSDIVYQFEWDDDADLDSSPLGSRTSDNETGCSPNCFENLTSGGDTSPFTEGNRIRFSIQSALTTGTTYYFRVRAKDVTGSNIYSEWSEVRSVTYVANTDPKAWFQTGDAQFDTGTLSGTETYGSESVRIATTPPVGAIVAYAEGSVTTPRYQVWDGDSWGGELSAQDVGAQIAWIRLAAAPTRDEYVLGTQDVNGDINLQVYSGGSWGNLIEPVTTIPNVEHRSFDVAYESLSGDAVVVMCDGDATPSYLIWNGTTWSATSSISTQFNAECTWIRMADSPTSDEVILLAQASSSNTTYDFEAQVWRNDTWGDQYTFGANTTEFYYEGMAVEWEDAGTEAVVVAMNTTAASFQSAWWSSVTQGWTTNTNRTIRNDFEWGELTADVGTNKLGLCLVNEDNQIQIAHWDGTANTWDVYDTNDTVDAGGKVSGTDDHGGLVSCQYETTSGRDGYLMTIYSDTTNGRYRSWTGSAYAGVEQSVSSIEDSWHVETVRTGNGNILSIFRDDTNDRYDFSYWNGSVWSSRDTLETVVADDAPPYNETFALAATRYQESIGTIVSPTIDFDSVPDKPTWGEVTWSTTEPANTDVLLQVYYATTTGAACTTIVPDGVLAGNSEGFVATSSPLDLSGLSTTTYNMICLKATLTSQTSQTPTLDDWNISWERQPYLTQTHFKWFANTNALTPTDAWPQGGDNLLEDEPIPNGYAPNSAAILRLRLAILDESVALSGSSTAFTLQWAEGSVCDPSLSWSDVGAIGSSTPWRGYNNVAVADGTVLPTRVLSSTDVSGTYEEENDTTVNPYTLSPNDEGEWDFVIQNNATSGTSYCFRVRKNDGTLLNIYDQYPQLITNSAPDTPTHNVPFTYEQVASTSPWFEFVAEDTKGDDLHYEVEVDDDYLFGSPVLDRNSQDHTTEFENVISPSDKSPFFSGQRVRFKPSSALANGTTYWWRVRARDPNGSNDWSAWSSPWSVTIDTGTTISTWHQTTEEQFAENDNENVEATSTDDIVLTPSNLTGTSSAPGIDFDWGTVGNAWGSLSWTENETFGSLRVRVEYWNGSSWSLIPESDLPGNGAGFNTGPVSLLSLDRTVYNEIRPAASLTNVSGSPRLNNWTVSWGLAVEQSTLRGPFDNEKVATTTPTFTFVSSDPQGDSLEYEFQWSASSSFAASTTRQSWAHAGFTNTASTTDTSPFVEGDTISFTVQQSDALINSTTYWWRVRARDPAPGGNAWSAWSSARSFTVDTAVVASTWFQTTDDQWRSDSLTDTEVYGNNSVRVTETIREALFAYAEGTVQTPRYMLWNGTNWTSERSAANIGDRAEWVRVAAAPTRNEYLMGTLGGAGTAVKAQIYTGSTTSWGNLVEIVPVSPSSLRRSFDVAYESLSGDALVVACAGTDAWYRTWTGSSWSATSTLDLTFSQNCEWIQLAADPDSNDIIVLARAAVGNTPTDYEAIVWDGAGGWNDSTTFGSALVQTDEAMTVMYEESGTDAVAVVGGGSSNVLVYNRYTAGSWVGSSTVAIGNDLNKVQFSRDQGTDRMMLTYIDEDSDISYVEWDGSTNTFGIVGTEIEQDSPAEYTNVAHSAYETTTGRDGYVMMVWGDNTGGVLTEQYSVLDRVTPLTAAQNLSTIGESVTAFLERTGDGLLLGVFFDDDNDRYDFSYWNGSQWSVRQAIEANANTQPTRTEPLSIVARRYPVFESGTVVSSAIDFDDGSGPKWGSFSWNDTTPGTSDIRYQVEYYSTASSSWELVPDAVLPYNSAGTSSGPVDLGALTYTTYNQIRLIANLTCSAGDCPTLNDWTVTWSEGITLSGTAQAYDQSTNVTSGIVAVAVNSTLQSGKTGTISGGVWSIANVTTFPGDVVTVFVDGAGDENEAVAVSKYDGVGDMTGFTLFERHLSLGSDDATTTTNTELALYDYSVSGDEDVFFDVDTGNDLYVCAPASGTCFESELYVKNGNTYRPDSANSGTLYVRHVEVNGTFTADSNTFYVSGSWDNNGTFIAGDSSVIFTATSTTETIDSSGASVHTWNTVTLGQGSGVATWNLMGTFDVDGNLTLSYGTLATGASSVSLAGNLTVGANGVWQKGMATTTFDGTGVSTWTDGTTAKQDLGRVRIGGSSKTVRLNSTASTTSLWIDPTSTFDVSSNNYAFTLYESFTNTGSLSARAGTVFFAATTTGIAINPGASSFYGATFVGVGGNWYFNTPTVTFGGNLTIATGTLTLAIGTTTVAGNFDTNGGSFMHNNGVLELIGTGSKTIRQNGYDLYDLTTNSSGSFSWIDTHATTSGAVRIRNGTLVLPTTLAVGTSFLNQGGNVTAGSGTLRMYGDGIEQVRVGGSSLANITFAGLGSWSFYDSNVTASQSVYFERGTTTLPSGTFTVGGSFVATSTGTFLANSGTVLFNGAGSKTIDPGATSSFAVVTVNDGSGSWTVTGNATSTGNFTLTAASSFTVSPGVTLAVAGTFTNSIPSATTWTDSTLALTSGTSYTVGSKSGTPESYGALRVGANTDIRMWLSDATRYEVNATGSLYSQDHGSVDGALYIFGDYVRASGADYWDYAIDFDGAALGGTSRPVQVRIATSSRVTLTGGSLSIVGSSTASTSIDHYGTDTYGVRVAGGTFTAQYYTFANLDALGLAFSGSPTISSLSDGGFTLGVTGGSLISASSSVIDANDEYQPYRVSFATSSSALTGSNVSVDGTPTSYWWFREHYGGFDGESYDNDPIVDPGAVRWDDSGFTIDIGGTVYAGEGSGGAPNFCDGSTLAITLVVDSVTYNATCTPATGAYLVNDVPFSGDVDMVAYIDGIATSSGATVSRTPQSDVTDFDIYQHRVIVRHEDVDPLTIARMVHFDLDQDADIPFDAEAGDLTLRASSTLFVWAGKTFEPGGNVTLNGNALGTSYDGSLRLDDGATLTMTGSEEVRVAGHWEADTGATFNAANSTVIFTATTSATRNLLPRSSFNDVVFSGAGATWNLQANTTVLGDALMTAGTLIGTLNFTVGGTLTGDGMVALTGGIATVQTSGAFGGASDWSFNALTLGNGSAGTTTKSGAGNVTVNGTLTVASAHRLEAGSVNWILKGASPSLTVSGTFVAQTSTTTFAGTSAMTVPALTYHNLVTAASGAGSPVYTFSAGNLSASSLTVGDGTNAVTAQVNTSDPLITVTGNVRINANATYSASNLNDLRIGGSYVNQGTFTSNSGGVLFNSTDTGEVVSAGNSSFHHVTVNGSGGGWTFGSATTTGNFTLSSLTSYTQTSGTTLKVQGAFTNSVGGTATEWAGSTLALSSGTNYTINTKTGEGDTYGVLEIGSNTDIRMWKSSATSYTVHPTGSLYSMDHAEGDGELYIFGDYVRSSGADYWSWGTDFDGTDISTTTPRAVTVRFAENATTTLSGGSLTILGSATASTTLTNQGSGTYALAVSGGTFSAQYYTVRNVGASGLSISGSPTISELSDGDFERNVNNGQMITVSASALNANPVKTWYRIRFATSTGVTGGANVKATGFSATSWRFTPALGNLYGEGYDDDPLGDPGMLVWENSNNLITVSGNFYSDEAGTVSLACDDTTQVIELRVAGGSLQTTSCDESGYYEFTGVGFSTDDAIMVYSASSTARAATVTVDPVSTIGDMHLYENRVVVRHEDTDPNTIARLAIYDSDQNPVIPFDADTGAPNTLTLPSNTKLIVWSGKTFKPDGNITLNSGSGSAWDGTLALQENAVLSASSTVAETFTVGGSWLTGTSSTFTAGLSTVVFTATSTGKTVSPDRSAFYNLTFNGIGGGWVFADRDATSTNNMTISAGTVEVGSSTLAVGGSLTTSDTFVAASTTLKFIATATGKTVSFNGTDVGPLLFSGSGGGWTMTDTHATSTGSVQITAGSVVMPTGTLAVAESFTNTGGSFTHAGELRLYGTLALQSIRTGTSALKHLTVAGAGSWSFADTNSTSTGDVRILAGALTAPSGTFGVGGSFENSAVFNANAGTLSLFATSTGKTVNPGTSLFSNVVVLGSGGGWTVVGSATTSGAFRLRSATSFTMATSTVLEVGGVFENRVGGAATDWTNSTLYLNASGTSYTLNTKSEGGDQYATTTVGANTNIRSWDSSSLVTSVHPTGSLYSMDHAGVSGDLYIYGAYQKMSGTDYWSYATDFDGTALGGGSRQVDVRVASSSSVTIAGGSLSMVGTASATTTVDVIGGVGGYGFSVSAGSVNFTYYQFRNIDRNGLVFTGTPTISSLDYGDFELALSGGVLISLASTTINQNPTKTVTGIVFATSSVITGTNIARVGTTSNFWDITGHYGNLAGEAYDDDGIDFCGSIHWDDSVCLEVTQTQYRIRNDDGNGGAPNSEWYDLDWSKRKRMTITNPNASTLTNYAVRFDVTYDGDMLGDFSDLRFTDSTGTTSIPYWIESFTTSATATIWVKIPSLPASGSATIFMYYGNAFAVSGANGSSVFTFFDDFEDNNISEYSGDTSFFDTLGTMAYEGSYGLGADAGSVESQTTDGIFQTSSTFGQGSTLRWFEYVDATKDDEPCTLFAVQSPGTNNQNYAVCLDQYPSEQVVLAENVSSNNGSGSTLDSEAVTFSTGWYEVEVDWLSGGSITVVVYDSTGATFATLSASDTSYSTGGSGFSFWYQSGGWDAYIVRPYAASEPSVSFGLEQENGGATWKAAQNTSTTIDLGVSFRVRFTVENSGPQISDQTFRLQYAPKTGYGTCGSVPTGVYNDVPNVASCGVSDVCMVTSTQFVDQDPTQQLLDTTTFLPMTSGYLIESPDNETPAMTLNQNTMTEIEYAIRVTETADENAYCLRVTDGGSELDSYAKIAEVTANYFPSVDSWILNGGSHIALIEGATTTIYATGTVSDLNGYGDIVSATSTLYRSGVGFSCVPDDNNCYQIATSSCVFASCSGASCLLSCRADVQFFAEPTDSGTYAAEEWLSRISIIDSGGNSASSTSQGRDMFTLWALSLTTSALDYGTLGVGDDTGTTNSTSTIRNTGNDEVAIEVAGSDLTAEASTIPVGNQKYASSTFTYSGCSICQTLTGVQEPLGMTLVKPTSSSTPITGNIYWGIYVPLNTAGAAYEGLNIFYPVGT